MDEARALPRYEAAEASLAVSASFRAGLQGVLQDGLLAWLQGELPGALQVWLPDAPRAALQVWLWEPLRAWLQAALREPDARLPDGLPSRDGLPAPDGSRSVHAPCARRQARPPDDRC